MTEPTPDTFAARLRSLLESGGVSVTDLAAKSGVNRQHIHRLLSGDREPSLSTAEKLAVALGKKLRHFEGLI